MDNFRIEMGNRMKEHRKSLHYTQEYMAEKLNISIKHYGGVERGIAGLSLENLICVSDILGVSLDYLVKGSKDSQHAMPKKIEDLYLSCPDEKKPYLIEMLSVAMHLI